VQLQGVYPVIVVDPTNVPACRDFYVHVFGFEIVFQATWFVYLSAGDNGHAIAFMASDHPSQPPGPETFAGSGMFVTLQVADAAQELARLEGMGVSIAYGLRDEAWGQRRFGVYDPAGVWVDVVQQIEPVPGFWDPFLMDPGASDPAEPA
jgi:catechol 2,3-dioxygenase-like lactoylglutathione lyase family enzyme